MKRQKHSWGVAAFLTVNKNNKLLVTSSLLCLVHTAVGKMFTLSLFLLYARIRAHTNTHTQIISFFLKKVKKKINFLIKKEKGKT